MWWSPRPASSSRCGDAVAFVIHARFPRTVRRVRRLSDSLDNVGRHALFYAESLRSIPKAAYSYRNETIRLIAEISMGTGALAVIGGTVVIVGFLTLFAGGTIAVQGYSSLGNIGVEALTGFFAAFINVRIAAKKPVSASAPILPREL